ncbi:MAG: transposase [Enterovirga sp.]|jgi:hypothetical protein|nr:transposase [Enterovirga sp.]
MTPVARREAVAYPQAAFALSQRRACTILGFDRTSIRYGSTRGDDAELRGRLRTLARERHRFGWRRLLVVGRHPFAGEQDHQPTPASSHDRRRSGAQVIFNEVRTGVSWPANQQCTLRQTH